MKKILILLFLFTSQLHTQEETTQEEDPFWRSLDFSIYAHTGRLNKSLGNGQIGNLFSGNTSEFSLGYSQNFQQVSWLSMWGSIAMGFSMDYRYDNAGNIRHNRSYGFDWATLCVGISVPYFSLAVDSELLIMLSTGYTYKINDINSVRISVATCFYGHGGQTGPSKPPYGDLGNNNVGTDLDDGPDNDDPTMLDYFGIAFSYTGKYHERLSFYSGYSFRFNGCPQQNWETGNKYKSDTWDAFVNSFNMRWDNRITYKTPSGLSFWTRVRWYIYPLKNLYLSGVRQVGTRSTTHYVRLDAGFSYSFDFANN